MPQLSDRQMCHQECRTALQSFRQGNPPGANKARVHVRFGQELASRLPHDSVLQMVLIVVAMIFSIVQPATTQAQSNGSQYASATRELVYQVPVNGFLDLVVFDGVL